MTLSGLSISRQPPSLLLFLPPVLRSATPASHDIRSADASWGRGHEIPGRVSGTDEGEGHYLPLATMCKTSQTERYPLHLERARTIVWRHGVIRMLL